MAPIDIHPLVAQGVQLYRTFPQISNGANERHSLDPWADYAAAVASAMASGSLDNSAMSAISLIAANVHSSASTFLHLERDSEQVIESLTERFREIVVAESHYAVKKRRSEHDPSNLCRTSKRTCRPSTTKYLPSPSPPPPSKPTKSLTSTLSTPNPPDPIRTYFLTHLSSPYPSASEKETLCKTANITRRKLESDLTNWRRRSDWTEIMNVYCGGDKGAMKSMIETIQRGEEEDEELLERFGKMRAYLEKRDEQAGDWVFELAELVESGKLTQIRSKRNVHQDDQSSSSSSSSSDEEEEYGRSRSYDQEQDAEGESEDDVDTDINFQTQSQGQSEFRYQPAQIPTSSTRYHKKVTMPFTTTPLQPRLESTSPLTEISPVSSISSHSLAPAPVDHLTYNHPPKPQLQHQQISYHPNPPLGDLKTHPASYHQIGNGHINGNKPGNQNGSGLGGGKGHASNKSSYSSLSAVSSLAAPRKRNISDSSTSTNLRSVSGSSTSSYPLYHDDISTNHLKRPSGQESHMRSSRARVEEMFPDLSTPTWVPGHHPNQDQGFNIGSNPRSMPYPYSVPPTYEYETPYHPNTHPQLHHQPQSQGQSHPGWEVQGEFRYLPHMDHINVNMNANMGGNGYERNGGDVGGFTMPREYDFTFAQSRN